MNKETSIYLDSIRFLAALVVVAGHAGEGRLGGGVLWHFIPFGSVAVVVFFVLSGYVVDYATQMRETDGTTYTLSRAMRIGSVAIPALILTVSLDSIGRHIDPTLYEHYYLSWDTFVVCLAFLNESWAHVTLGSNEPFWSLGYEVPFYVLYGVSIFASGRWRAVGLGVASLLFGPRVIALFPMWLLGVISYRISLRSVVGEHFGWLLLMSSLLVGSTILIFTQGSGTLRIDGMFDHSPLQLSEDYLFAALFAVHLIGFSAVSSRFTWTHQYARPVRWLAGATFSLYLFHFPILVFASAIISSNHYSLSYSVVSLAASVAGAFLLAELTERRKVWWQRSLLGLAKRVRSAW
jgi:peptidoglycan/LPS O-acetylase OafA/YrhL